jgi:hypothetical protein
MSHKSILKSPDSLKKQSSVRFVDEIRESSSVKSVGVCESKRIKIANVGKNQKEQINVLEKMREKGQNTVRVKITNIKYKTTQVWPRIKVLII